MQKQSDSDFITEIDKCHDLQIVIALIALWWQLNHSYGM